MSDFNLGVLLGFLLGWGAASTLVFWGRYRMWMRGEIGRIPQGKSEKP